MTQAQRIINRFGNANKLYEAVKASGSTLARSTPYKWLERGFIPHQSQDLVIRAAAFVNVTIKPEDWRP